MSQGSRAEKRAENHLIQQGLILIERNFRARTGEIDLIMRDQASVVFVEVRQRTHQRFGGALESVDNHKQRKLLATAAIYLQKWGAHLPPCRFDVVLIEGEEEKLSWIRDAFSA